MAQLTIRADDEIVERVRITARAEGKSVNGWVVELLTTATDPEYAGSDAERMRERLRRAGILADEGPPPPGLRRPDPEDFDRARREASKGRSLSDLIIEDREE